MNSHHCFVFSVPYGFPHFSHQLFRGFSSHIKSVLKNFQDTETENTISNATSTDKPSETLPSSEKDDDTLSVLSAASTVKTEVDLKRNTESMKEEKKEEEEEVVVKEEEKREECEKKVVKEEPKKAKKKEEKLKPTHIPVFRSMRDMARNPITGVGLEADLDRPRKNQCKKG